MVKYGLEAAIIRDPVNIRYATGTRNMAIRSIMFELTGCPHLAQGYEAVDEVCTAKSVTFTSSGPKIHDKESKWAQEMAHLIESLVGNRSATVDLEHINANVAIALQELGLNIVDAQRAIEMARTIKSPEEVKYIVASLRATEVAVGKLRDAINRDYIETRLLSTVPRTSPWFQESASYVIQKNDLVALDTDSLDPPTEQQKELYRTALAQLNHDMSILRPGLTFSEYADLAWDVPEQYWANRYFVSAHVYGLTGQCRVIESGMALYFKSYIDKEGDTQGVKLEQQVLITETEIQVLSKFPSERAMLK
ncbi:peptidase yqhT [Fusarium pseudoanthophilum]|uniref:Peptidase yqhT n=1 Tax=Fusarium pseudoanthophilum TaxID=48495 RepID=A0A8H5NUI3_9HYPO|nr:peptidase yqhT [Fusarium pseudoanthophilum]